MTNGLKIARWAWLIAAGATVALALRLVGHIWSEAGSVGPPPPDFKSVGHYRLSSAQARALTDVGLSPDWHAALITIRFVLVVVTAVGIATLLWRRARTWAPLFLSWVLLSTLAITSFTDNGSEGELPDWLGLPVVVLFGGGAISLFGLLLVFPDDRSARWVVAAFVSATVVPIYATATSNDALGDWLWDNVVYVAGALALGGLAIQVARIVRSRDRTARDLLLLTVFTIGVLITLAVGAQSWSGIEGSRAGLGSLVWRLGYESLFMGVPLIYGLAVLWILVRRGHWDMDVQLKGSVGYAGLTSFLVLGYFGVVAVVQAVVNDVSGAAGSTFALMVSTAVIAAAFLPARSGLQRLVDRVFDRRRRDAERMVEAFETGVVRDSRPDEVAGALLGAVDDVFRPERADLWLAPETQS